MKNYLRKYMIMFISTLDSIIKKNNDYVVYNSFPDFSDNSFAVFIHIIEKYPNKKNIWLVTDTNRNYIPIIENYTKKKNYLIIKRDSLQGLLYYIKSKYIFFTHGIMTGIKVPKNHCVVNFWHGMPLKSMGLVGSNNTVIPQSNYMISTSIFYQDIFARAFNIKKENVLIVGQPRNDLMFKSNNFLLSLGINKNQKKIVLWTPTYRESIIGDIRIDGLSTNDLPVVKSSDLCELDEFLNKIETHMIIKLHPMDILNNHKFTNYNNITILNKHDFELQNYQLYSLLNDVDILLTDFSSIYIDFLLLNRPIGFVIDDFSQYTNSRGFVFENPSEYMPGEKIDCIEKLKNFLYKTILLQEDNYIEERVNLNNKINSEHIFNYEEFLNKIEFNNEIEYKIG